MPLTIETMTPPIPDRTQVLVVGSGPVGMCLAGDLGTRGIDCLLIEQSDGSIHQPKMDLVGVRTMEFCRRWGLLDDVDNCPYPRDYRQDCVWITGVTGFEFDRERFTSRGDEKPATGSPQKRERCPQDMFDPILFKFAASQKTTTIRHLCRLVSFEDRGDHVIATVEDLTDNSQKEIRADYLVGCDGAASSIRSSLGITMSGYPALTYTTNVIFKSPQFRTLHDKGEFYRFIVIGPNGAWCTIVAIDGMDRYRMSIIGNDQPKLFTDEEIRDAIRRAVGVEFDYEIESVLPWIRRLMVADSFGRGRVLLAGDAVHMFSPTGGFGMNTGIQASVDLSWKLEAVLRGWGGPHLLESYEHERRPIGIRNITEAGENLRRMTMPKCEPILFEDSDEGAKARKVFGKAYTAAMRREWFTTGIHIGYRYEHSPIIVPDGTPEPPDEPAIYVQTSRPGHRAPHVWLTADGRSTIDLFGTGFVLMRLGDDAPDGGPLKAAAEARSVPLTEFECCQPDVVVAYEKRLVLVRPDGHVAWRGDDLPADADDLLATVTGHKAPSKLPRPEVEFGERSILLQSGPPKKD